jgi:hypothetical protein
MKMKNRNPVTVFLLSIVTLGIYDIYWLVQTKKVLNKETKFHTPTIWLLFAPAVLLIPGYVGLFINISKQTSDAYYASSSSAPLPHPALFFVSFITIFLGFLSAFFISAFWFFKFSKAVNEYTRGKMSTAVTFLILWLIHLIGVALVQDAFNDD